ncbi:tellurite resistance/C4-dicarboxylate transporter family protein [Kitasatospora sp. NPDC002227]|uniref:tellurite resistance/C4-dicarboxylate transporter family protein n=1 Tax=Kitasatospora sp. NPDC002227 TaxID=3154773 RepID=UPI00332955A3
MRCHGGVIGSRGAGVPGSGSGGWWVGVPPAAGAVVMATGIVSVGLRLVGQAVLSWVLVGLAAVGWGVLAVAFGLTFVRDRGRWRAHADTPAALCAVAATAVLGTRAALEGWVTGAGVLLAVAALAWPGLLVAVLRHWQHHLPGAVFLVCVATNGLAVLAATLGTIQHRDWLTWCALAAFVLGLGLYLAALTRFDLRQVEDGLGDQWIAAGALAISALAAAKLTAWPHWTGAAHATLRGTALVLLVLALPWFVVLLGAEVRHPRPHYNLRRWATVFPLGMTAVATLSVGSATGVHWLRPLGQVLLWIAVAAWAVTAALLVATSLRRSR